MSPLDALNALPEGQGKLNAIMDALRALPPDGTLVPGERQDFVANQRKALQALFVAELRKDSK